MKQDNTAMQIWYHQRKWSLFLGLVFLLMACGVGLRALDTGSFQQYFLTIIFLVLSVNRLIQASKGKKNSK